MAVMAAPWRGGFLIKRHQKAVASFLFRFLFFWFCFFFLIVQPSSTIYNG